MHQDLTLRSDRNSNDAMMLVDSNFNNDINLMSTSTKEKCLLDQILKEEYLDEVSRTGRFHKEKFHTKIDM